MKDIIGTRHILVHDYFGIDLEIVSTVVENDLPPQRTEVAALLERIAGPDQDRT